MKNLEGLQHHWTETQEFIGEYYELIETYNIEVHTFNQMKIIQSLLGIIRMKSSWWLHHQ